MRFRITVRGEGVELRGYIDSAVGDGSAALNRFAEHMKPNVVVASPAEGDYDPFKEQEHRELHHFEVEQENARLEADNARLEAEVARLRDNLDKERAEHEATLHVGQDYLATLDRVRTARSNHLEMECPEHADDDPITCGWKSAVRDIDEALYG